MDMLEIGLKLLLAVALGGLVGIERETSQKPAGFRTNILICLGATMIMILSELVLGEGRSTGGDTTRLAAAVVTGIGFIGAGSIIQARGMVIGITTAATIWTVGILGIVIGTGYYLPAVIYTAIIMLILMSFRRIEDLHLTKALFRYTIKAKTTKETLISIKKLALHENIRFKEFSHRREGNLSVISFAFQAPEDKERRFSRSLSDLEGIIELKID